MTGCGGQLGIMDPTFCFGQMGVVSGLDLAAFDTMGWNLSVDAMRYQNTSTASIHNTFGVAEPTSWALAFTAHGLMGAVRRCAARKATEPSRANR